MISQFVADMERGVVNWALAMVSEIQDSQEVDSDNTGRTQIHCSGGGREIDVIHPDRLRQLAIAVVDIFAQTLKKCNSAWPVIAVYGEGLER